MVLVLLNNSFWIEYKPLITIYGIKYLHCAFCRSLLSLSKGVALTKSTGLPYAIKVEHSIIQSNFFRLVLTAQDISFHHHICFSATMVPGNNVNKFIPVFLIEQIYHFKIPMS